MSRSLKKGPFVDEKLFNRIVAMNESNNKQIIKTWSRASTIYPEFVGHTIAVHNGKSHISVFITEDMESAFNIANELAPEHLELAFEGAEKYLDFMYRLFKIKQ